MKRLLIGDYRESLLSTLETILRHWGYRVLVSSRPEDLMAFLRETPPDLLVMGAGLLHEVPALREAVATRVEAGGAPLIVLGQEEEIPSPPLSHDLLQVPIDLFSLFELIQKYLEKYPRKHLRLSINLPGMLCLGDSCQLAEVLSLSVQGLFIKTGFRLEKEDRVNVVIPLLGMQKELEIESRVLYRIHPDPENNYLQGMGLEFDMLRQEDRKALEEFLENRFFGEISDRPNNAPTISSKQVRSRSEKPVLHLM